MLNKNRRSLTEGDFGGYLPLYGGMLTEGDFWPRQIDAYTIYRGQDGVIDYDWPVAIMAVNIDSILITGQSLPASSQWWYVRRKVKGCCGLEGNDSVPCKVRIGDDGQMIGNAPNPPVDLMAELMAGGRVRLRWRYVPGGQDTPAFGFAIYLQLADIPLTTINWYRKPLSEGDFRPILEDCAWMLREGDFGPYGNRIDDEIPCGIVQGSIARNNAFIWNSPSLTHGKIYRFIVRSYSDDGTLSDSTARVDVIPDAVGPLASVTPTADWTEL
ncbi:hypothetical protein ACQ9LF_06115 [Anaerohalosphaeraceae bacterium U12dextr]|jgi:hypothetical protein